jgi:hypothetical protein
MSFLPGMLILLKNIKIKKINDHRRTNRRKNSWLLLQIRKDALIQRETFLFGRKVAVLDLILVGGNRVLNYLSQVSILPGMFRYISGCNTQQISHDLYLAITARAADAAPQHVRQAGRHGAAGEAH